MTINGLSDTPLKPTILEKVFDKYWGEFQERFDEIIASNPLPVENAKRDEEDVLSEVLTVVRSLDKRINRIEELDNKNKVSSNANERQRMKDYTIQLANMIAHGQSFEELRLLISKTGYSDAEIKNMIAEATNLASSTRIQPINVDMLEQLKVKFGK